MQSRRIAQLDLSGPTKREYCEYYEYCEYCEDLKIAQQLDLRGPTVRAVSVRVAPIAVDEDCDETRHVRLRQHAVSDHSKPSKPLSDSRTKDRLWEKGCQSAVLLGECSSDGLLETPDYCSGQDTEGL